MKCNINFLFIFLFCSLINFAYSDIEELEDNKEVKSIYIDNKIIYILTDSANNEIKSYPSGINGEYETSYFSIYKNILKIDDSRFIIIGQASDGRLCHRIFNINDISSGGTYRCTRSNYEGISKVEGKYVNDNQFIIFYLINRDFMIYLFELNGENPIKTDIVSTIPLNLPLYTPFIKCESFSGNDYFCIYFYQDYKSSDNSYFWIMNYSYGDFNSKIASGNMCNEICQYGDIIKIIDTKEKYLICYIKFGSNSYNIDNIICQYYYYENGNLNFGKNYDIMKGSSQMQLSPPILLLYENSIFMLFNYYLDDSLIATRMILFSPDLKFNAHFSIINRVKTQQEYKINNFIVIPNSYFLIFNEDDLTYLFQSDFKISGNDLSIILSNKNDYKGEIEFSGNNQVMLSIDENLNLYRDEEIVGMTGVLDLSSTSGEEKYTFRRNGHPIGVFYNYINYINSFSSGFSLIYKVTVTVCYDSCNECVKEKIGNSENHFCTECFNKYYPISGKTDPNNGFNCYSSNEPEIINYYEKDSEYYKCNESCKSCFNITHCKSCNNDYYFKTYLYNNVEYKIEPGLCFKGLNQYYYLDSNENIDYEGSNNKIVYKRCHSHCLSCYGLGTNTDNNCKECLAPYIKYNNLDTQCRLDKQICLNNNQYWEFKDNNVECADYTDTKKYIVMYDESKGQIVDDCATFKSPYLLNTMYFSLNDCNGINYCVPLSICLRGEKTKKFVINTKFQTCQRTRECDIDFNDDDPFKEDEHQYPTIYHTSGPIDYDRDQRERDASKREKIWRKFDEDNEFIISDFADLIETYTNTLLNLQSIKNDIYLITTFKYKNYTINIYPLDVEFEKYVYNHIIIPYNLNYIDFLEYFTNFWEMEFQGELLMIALIESNCANSSMNELNYYFYKFKESNLIFEPINLPSGELSTKGDNIDVIYSLKNYKNSKSNINNRNTEHLVDNIRSMYNKYPDIELSNIDDPFYNDICTLYTTDVDTDMTLNDRRKEFYVNISLCENNCVLKKVINKDLNVKSVCNCKIKNEYTSNTNEGKADNIPLISSYNIESFVCINKAFKSQNISKNPIFWILLLIIIFLIVMVLAYVLYGNDVLKRIFKLGKYEKVNENSITQINNKISGIKIISNEENKEKEIENQKENENENERDIISQNKMIDSKIDKNEGSSKYSKIEDNKDSIQSNDNVNILSNNNINSNKIDVSNIENNKKENANNSFSISENNNINNSNKDKAGIKKEETSYKNNPPKKKEERKNDSMFTKTNNEDKDLISSDISFSKRFKEDYNNSEISFDKISKEKPIYIDNLVNPGEMLENNYLDFPLNFEKNMIISIYRNALELNEEENDDPEINNMLHHYDTFEDYYEPQSEENNDKNNVRNMKAKKLKKKKNHKVIKLLDGDDTFIKSEKNYESDNYYDKNNNNKKSNKNKSKNKDNFEDDLFDDNLFINNIDIKKFTNKKNPKKNLKNKIIEESKQNFEQEKENSSKNGIKLREGKNRFIQYLNKKTSNNNNEESKYGNEEDYKNSRLKTDFNDGAKNMIKSTLKYIGKEGLSSDESGQSSSFNKNFNFKSYNSLMSEKNKFIGKKDTRNNNNENNDLKNGRRQILQFQEEDNYIGNNLIPLKTIKKNKTSKKKKLKNKKGEQIDVSEDIEEKKSDFDVFYEKALGSSIASFANIENDKVIIEENIFKYFWKYFKKRELFIICFFDQKDTLPYFLRWSCFFFSLIFIFLLNCFFFFESNVHKRYIHALKGEKINIAYYFKYEFGLSMCVSLITIVYKMLVIKILLYRVLKIKKDEKKMMHHSFEEKLDKKELKNIKQKRIDYLLNYHHKIIIYFSVMIFLSLFFTYICICYGGVFENSLNVFFLGFFFSAIFSFIFCAAICFIIVGINKISRMFKNKCLLSTYVVLSTIY